MVRLDLCHLLTYFSGPGSLLKTIFPSSQGSFVRLNSSIDVFSENIRQRIDNVKIKNKVVQFDVTICTAVTS